MLLQINQSINQSIKQNKFKTSNILVWREMSSETSLLTSPSMRCVKVESRVTVEEEEEILSDTRQEMDKCFFRKEDLREERRWWVRGVMRLKWRGARRAEERHCIKTTLCFSFLLMQNWMSTISHSPPPEEEEEEEEEEM